MAVKLKDIAVHLDLDLSGVSKFCTARGIDLKTATMEEIRLAYIRRLRSAATGRGAGDGSFDLVTERARLTAAQADNMELKNAVIKKEYLPAEIISATLMQVGKQIVGVLESIPVKLKRRAGIGHAELKFIEEELIKARNIAAAIKIELPPED